MCAEETKQREHLVLYLCVVYRAGTSVHCALVEFLPHCEGDVGGADCGGGFNRQRLSVLRDLH